MILKIKMEFYLKKGHILIDEIAYQKSSDKVSDEDFIKDVEDKLLTEREKVNNKLIVGSNEFYQFSNIFVKLSEVVGYKSYIQIVEENLNEDNYEDENDENIVVRDFDEEKEDNIGEIVV